MRRLVLLTAVAALAIAGVAYAVTDTVTYSTKISFKGKPSSKKPANLNYTGILHIDTDPQGQQPEKAPSTSVYYSKGIKNNAKYFPFCSQKEIDGKPSIPSKCKKAIIGSGTASALAGVPGQPTSSSVREDLNVTAVNGTSGKFIMLVLNSKPGAPVGIQNRVVPGAVAKASGQYGFLTNFIVPKDLQEQLGLSIALVDFKVNIPGTAHSVKVSGKTKKISYLQVTSCKGSLPAKALATFTDADTGGPKPVGSAQSNAKC